jgi:putative copper export protein
MNLLAATRPTDWDFALFLHILGATILVGGLVTAVGMQSLAWRKREPDDVRAFSRWGFWSLLTVALPGWVLMRIGAEWIYSKEGWTGEDDPSWLGIGFTVADIGLPVLVIAIILAGLGVRQVRKAGTSVFGRVATPLAIVLLVAYLVAVWAMTAKPD